MKNWTVVPTRVTSAQRKRLRELMTVRHDDILGMTEQQFWEAVLGTAPPCAPLSAGKHNHCVKVSVVAEGSAQEPAWTD